ncbi:cold shock domain-containing protein [candidate division KSB1 bacterium]|nr:cold shock domain-containing protein [candidate division KSB1 bacterium]
MKGKIDKIFRDKGFGFIHSDSGSQVFFHKSDLIGTTFTTLQEGNTVEFNEEQTDKGPRASDISKVHSLTVTPNAKIKLRETIQTKSRSPEKAIRLITSENTPNGLRFAFDRERQGDHVVTAEDGKKILLVAPDIIQLIEGMTIDYDEKSEGASFTIN